MTGMNRRCWFLLLGLQLSGAFAGWDTAPCSSTSCLRQGVSDAAQAQQVSGNVELATGTAGFVPPQGDPSTWNQQAMGPVQQNDLGWVTNDFSHLDASSAQSLRQQVETIKTTTPMDPISCAHGTCLQGLLPKSSATSDAQRTTRLYLGMMQSMQQERDASGLTVFPGRAVDCVDNGTLVGSTHCCRSGVGALQTIWRRGCSSVDRLIEQARQAGTATYIDGWKSCAAHTAFGICIRRQQHYSFCLWPSVLARIVQEQGRAQWGQKVPRSCSGLTLNPDQLAQIKLDQLDYHDYWVHQP